MGIGIKAKTEQTLSTASFNGNNDSCRVTETSAMVMEITTISLEAKMKRASLGATGGEGVKCEVIYPKKPKELEWMFTGMVRLFENWPIKLFT